MIKLEDADIPNLRTLNLSTSRAKFSRFWRECESVLNKKVGVAVDDRRHTEVTHLATAIFIRDLCECVKQRLPADTPRVASFTETKHAMKL